MKVSILLPIFNEASVIEKTIATIVSIAPKYFTTFEIIAVNDGSTDQTQNILDALQENNRYLRVFKHRKNIGYGAAFRTGVKRARFPWLFFTDADLQFNVREIKHFQRESGYYDIIVGWRTSRADSWQRKIASSIYNKIVRLFFSLPLRDVDCAFKLMRRDKVRAIRLTADSFFISAELLIKAMKKNYRIKEIGVGHYPRVKGHSKVTMNKVLQTLRDLIILYGRTNK